MCRIYAHLATEPTRVLCPLARSDNALVRQSCGDYRGERHPDGWGMGFYHGPRPEVVRSLAPAGSDPYFDGTAERVYSKVVLAHVRQASVGSNRLTNTHPFQFESWVFAHNGTVARFAEVSERLEAEIEPRFLALRRGSTDSELVFYWLLSRLAAAGLAVEGQWDPRRAAPVLSALTRDLAAWTPVPDGQKPTALNLVLTNGRLLLASRWGRTLSYRVEERLGDCEVCGEPHVQHAATGRYRAVLVASEPIGHAPWKEFPEGAVLAVDTSGQAELFAA